MLIIKLLMRILSIEVKSRCCKSSKTEVYVYSSSVQVWGTGRKLC